MKSEEVKIGLATMPVQFCMASLVQAIDPASKTLIVPLRICSLCLVTNKQKFQLSWQNHLQDC